MLSNETPGNRGFVFLEIEMTPVQFTEWREAIGGRRFIMTLGGNMVNTVLFASGLLSEQGYLTTFAGTVGAYLLMKHMQERTPGANG